MARNRVITAAQRRAREWFNRFWDVAGAVSVRTKILGIVLALVALLGFGVTLQVRAAMRQALVTRLQEQSVSIARDVAARSTDLILINDLYALHELLVETQANHPDVRYAFVLDPQQEVIAHTFGSGFPPDLITANLVSPAEHHHTIMLTTDEGVVWDTAVPIFDGRSGIARVGISESGLQAAMAALSGQLLLIIVLVSAVGIGAASLLTWVVTRPILNLKQAAQAVGKGDFTQRVPRWAGDEIGDLAEAFNAMTAELARMEVIRAEREQLRAQVLEQVIGAQEEERKRIARELHDETGQALTALMVRLRTLNELCPIPELKPQLREVRKVLSQTLENVHNLALELRPSVLDDLGLTAAIERYVSDCRQRYPFEIDFAAYGLNGNRLPPVVETALYRIVQEALTNVARHAQAQTASILVECYAGRVRVVIEDDGIGFDFAAARHSSKRLGVHGMDERAKLLGGVFTVESEPGRGTSIFVEVPITANDGNQNPARG